MPSLKRLKGAMQELKHYRAPSGASLQALHMHWLLLPLRQSPTIESLMSMDVVSDLPHICTWSSYTMSQLHVSMRCSLPTPNYTTLLPHWAMPCVKHAQGTLPPNSSLMYAGAACQVNTILVPRLPRRHWLVPMPEPTRALHVPAPAPEQHSHLALPEPASDLLCPRLTH